MAVYNEVKMIKTLIGKLKHGSDLLEQLTEICRSNNTRLGRIEAIGAVKKARLGYYDQQKRQYKTLDIDRPMEITSLIGNISLRDGEPMVHAHLTLADSDGTSYGGHLQPGTIVFAGEFIIDACEGPQLDRNYDDQTGLALWEI